MKYVIEVHHQTGIHTYECENLWETASYNLSYFTYNNMEDAEKMFGDDIPEELSELLNKEEGAVVEISEERFNDYFLEKDFDKESYAIDYLGHDLNRLIVIESKEDAEYYATKYKDHEWVKVQIAAQNILEKMLEDEKLN